MHFWLFKQNRPSCPYLTHKVLLGVLENTNNNHMIGVKRCLFHPDTLLFSDKYIPSSFFSPLYPEFLHVASASQQDGNGGLTTVVAQEEPLEPSGLGIRDGIRDGS